jgi:hypothetical protein
LKLTDRETVNLTFSDDKTLATLLPEMLTEELHTLRFANPAELFVLHADMLGYSFTLLVEKRSRMAWKTSIFRYTVAEELTGFLSQSSLGEGTIGDIKEI